MKYLLPLFITLLFSFTCQAQLTSLQAGPVVSFFGKGENNYGGELVSAFKVQKNISTGIGLQVLKFSPYPNVFIPVFATLRISLPSNKFIYYFHIDPGYIISHYYSSYTDTANNGVFKFEYKNISSFYLGSGAGIHLKTKASPYINIQYSLYHLNAFSRVTNISQLMVYDYPNKKFGASITISGGIWLTTKKK